MKRVPDYIQKIGLPFLGSTGLVLLGYGMMLIPHYSVDSYSVALNQMCMYWSGCKAGRPMFMALVKLCTAWNFNLVQQQWVCTLSMLFSCIVCHLLLYRAVRRYVCKQLYGRKAVMVFCCLAIVFCNPFLLEWFQYVEITPIYSICICLTILAVTLILRNKQWDWLGALLCLLVAITGYQVVISIFLILSAVFLLIKYEYLPTRKAFWEMVRCVAITGTAGVVSLLCAKWLPAKMGIAARLSEISFYDNLRYVLSIQSQLWKSTFGLLPGGWVIGFLLFCMVITLIPFVIRKDWKQIFWSGFVLAGCAATIFLPYAVSSEHWTTARSSVQFFSFVSGAAVIAVLNAENIRAHLVHGLSLGLLAVLLLQTNRITMDQLRTNQYDKAECTAIAAAIDEYEKDTGITVNGIAFCTDERPHYYYPDIRWYWAELNMRAMVVDWGFHDVISFYTGRPLANRGTIKPPVFEARDWNEFNLSEQLYFEGDTVYFCVF